MMPMVKRAALAAAVMLTAGAAHAACDTVSYIEQCKAMLSDGYSVVTAYQLDGEADKVGSISDDTVLSTRLSYQVTVCGAEGNAITFALEAASGETVLSNKDGDAYRSSLTFTPPKMTVYNLVFSAPSPAELCGGAVLGVKR